MITAYRRDWDDGVVDVRLRRLVRLAYNVRWTWEPRAAAVFESLAPDIWRTTRNPIAVLRALEAGDVRGWLCDNASVIDAAVVDLERYLHPFGSDALDGLPRIAYLCAEFALASCLPIYSGGLGVLAGDHLKTASDLGVPVIGVGLLYRFGYFSQRLDAAGRQVEEYELLDPTRLPLRPVLVGARTPCRIRIPFPHRQVLARAWQMDVGRTRLYLLDTNLPENSADDRWITGHLYGGDEDTRLRQEMVLGIGGARLLRALQSAGLEPEIRSYHLNEGHAAMLILELARERLAAGCAGSFEGAVRQVAQTVAFTTHTSESAGHDIFQSSMIEAYLADYRRELGVSHAALMQLGHSPTGGQSESFNMTVLALRGSGRRNGVSTLHARIAGANWQGIGIGTHDRPPLVPMDAITNGVHAPTWIGPEMARLFDAWLGRLWRVSARTPAVWAPLVTTPRAAIWDARTAQRARLMAYAQLEGDPARAMVIGFARRFTTYKRAALLLQDPDGLARLLTSDSERPISVVLAGKAHPRDEPGKLLMQRIVEASGDERFRGRLVFLPDYDVDLARLLVQGADLWLNTPRRLHEACGTSGMKATLNGALNLSSLDGWWDEAFQPDIGWALGADLCEDMTESERDAAEAAELMSLLECQVIPAFYDRHDSALPNHWLDTIVRSIVTLAPFCTAERMLVDYAARIYAESALHCLQTASDF